MSCNKMERIGKQEQSCEILTIENLLYLNKKTKSSYGNGND